MVHLIIPTSNCFWKKRPLIGDDDKGLRIFKIILLKFSFWAQMKIKKSFKYKEMLNYFFKVKRTVYKVEEIFQLVRERERESP